MRRRYYHQTIDKTWTNKPPVGYCTYQLHRGAITIAILQNKKCDQKYCRYFRRNRDHPIWKPKRKKGKKHGKNF